VLLGNVFILCRLQLEVSGLLGILYLRVLFAHSFEYAVGRQVQVRQLESSNPPREAHSSLPRAISSCKTQSGLSQPANHQAIRLRGQPRAPLFSATMLSSLSPDSAIMTTPFQNALLIHNPNAGNGGDGRRKLLDQARRILLSNGIEAELAETTGPGHATEIAQQAVRERRQLVIACGGDGTLNEVVNGLATATNGNRVPLALLPGGTANILAKELDLPWDIPRAARRLIDADLRDIALGLATPLEDPSRQRFFLSVSGAGPDGMIVYSLDLGLKARVGILAYWWQGAREVLRYTFPRFRVRAGNRQMEATLVIVGRTKNYGGPFKITDQADLFEDQFEVMALTTRSGLRYLSYLPTLWLGNLRKEDDVHFWKADTLICEPLDGHPVYAQIDGEPLARLPVEFSIMPRALQLLVPRDSARPAS
jgi:diacylglycerol kinase (ATP)